MGFIGDFTEALTLAQKVMQILTDARSVILEIDNHTDSTLRKVSEHHDHGGWAETPTELIPPQKVLVFGSQSVGGGIAVGTEGTITYAGDGIELTVYWDDPWIGSNSCNLTLTGPNAMNYTINKECGSGNQNAKMRYELFYAPVNQIAQGDHMNPGDVLAVDRPITSANGTYTFIFQNDGNLVLYENFQYGGRKALWSSKTNGKDSFGICVMQSDGNLVIYDTYRKPIWSSNTWGHSGSRLVVQNDGNVVIYQADGKAIWATNTVQPVPVIPNPHPSPFPHPLPHKPGLNDMDI